MRILKSFEEIIVKTEIAFLVVFMGVMVLLAFLQVVLRNVFSTGILWADTLLRYLVLWVAFLGAAVATKEERHIRIDAFTRFISPYVRNLISILSNLIGIVVCYYLLSASFDFFKTGVPEDAVFLQGIPLFYSLMIIPIGFGLMLLHFAIRIILKINLALNKSAFWEGKI